MWERINFGQCGFPDFLQFLHSSTLWTMLRFGLWTPIFDQQMFLRPIFEQSIFLSNFSSFNFCFSNFCSSNFFPPNFLYSWFFYSWFFNSYLYIAGISCNKILTSISRNIISKNTYLSKLIPSNSLKTFIKTIKKISSFNWETNVQLFPVIFFV